MILVEVIDGVSGTNHVIESGMDIPKFAPPIRLVEVSEEVPFGKYYYGKSFHDTPYSTQGRKQTILSLYEFRKRFTFDEKVAIKSSSDIGVVVVQEDMAMVNEIDLNNADLIAGMGYLTQQGLLTEERMAEILTADEV